jgi:hypothetical protein
LELYNEITLSRKPFEVGHMYIYPFLTDTMTHRILTFPSGTLCTVYLLILP